MALLEVDDLRVTFATDDGPLDAVRGVSFSVDAGETIGIVGESGSGKSVTTQAITQLIAGADVRGRATFDGHDLLTMPSRDLRHIRGERIGMVFQDPLSSLHPQYRVGWQIEEAIRAHERVSRSAARSRAVHLLDEVGIPEPDRRAEDFPHQFSGGMRQRVMLAMALARRPELLIADEPTTALDVTVQAQLLDLLRKLQQDHGTAIVMITHDLGVIAEVADRVLTMYAGRIVERATRDQLFAKPPPPLHPFSARLHSQRQHSWRATSSPSPVSRRACCTPRRAVPSSPGVPSPWPSAATACPPIARSRVTTAHRATCPPRPWGLPSSWTHRATGPSTTTSDAELLPKADPLSSKAAPPLAHTHDSSQPPLVKVRGLVKHFAGPRQGLLGRPGPPIRAVDGIDLEVEPGRTLAVVGESGSGKSTLARMITGLITPTAGSVEIDGKDLASLDRRGMTAMRRQVQMIFQDPYGSLNPRRRVGSIIADPLVIHDHDSGLIRERVQHLMELVGLNPEHYNRYPSDFSGGQRQRIGVARALALNPRLIVCDEPVSALDVSIQAQIVNLLEDLQSEFDLTYVVIAHDLGVVQHLADRVAVMYLGQVVELADTDALFADPRHPYTRALLDAAPVADPAPREARAVLSGDVPSPISPPDGCNFNPRCPRAEQDCSTTEPLLATPPGDPARRMVSCLHPLSASPTTLAGVS